MEEFDDRNFFTWKKMVKCVSYIVKMAEIFCLPIPVSIAYGEKKKIVI
jgi:hypothetical protein